MQIDYKLHKKPLKIKLTGTYHVNLPKQLDLSIYKIFKQPLWSLIILLQWSVIYSLPDFDK